MSQINLPQNPGLGDFKELTPSEKLFIQTIADHSYTDGQLIIGNSSTGGVSLATLTQGSGVTITNGHGTITISASSAGGLTVGTSTITSGSTTNILYNNAGVLGEYTVTGTGTVVVMATSPTLVTPTLGVATGTSLTLATADSATNTTVLPFSINHTTSSTPTTNFGVGQMFQLHNASNTLKDAGEIDVTWSTATAGSEASTITVKGMNAGAQTSPLTISGGGTVNAGAQFQVPSTGNYMWAGRGVVSSPTAGSVQLGNTDVDTNASIVAQTLRTQGTLVGGTSDQAGKNFTVIVSPGKGTGTGGSFIVQTAPAGTTGTTLNSPVTALTIDSTKLATFAGNLTVGTSNSITTGTIELGAASDTTLSRVSAGVMAVEGSTVGMLPTIQTWTAQNKFNNIIDVNNAVTVTTNAGTVPVTFKLNTFTNSSAATMAITMATASAVDGQMTIVRIYDFSGVAQTIGWTNTENSTVSVPTTSNGSTTLPLTVGLMYNTQTSKWRCIASA